MKSLEAVVDYVRWKSMYPDVFFDNINGVYAKLHMTYSEIDKYMKLIDLCTTAPESQSLNTVSTVSTVSTLSTLSYLHCKLHVALRNRVYFCTFLSEYIQHVITLRKFNIEANNI